MRHPVFDGIREDRRPDDVHPWARVEEAALAVRSRLADLDLLSFVKTTGGKGLHVVVPLTPGKQTWDQVKSFARGIAREFTRAAPKLFTASATKSGRVGKIYVDYLRNYRGSTSVAPYSVRARPGAPVSVPLAWDELETLASSQVYTLKNLAERLSGRFRDPWRALPERRQFLNATALREVIGKHRDTQVE
jgi:bifunctional non-homologous end joining protein LigD